MLQGSLRSRSAAVLVSLVVGLLLVSPPVGATIAHSPRPSTAGDWELCHGHIAVAEHILALPPHILSAVAKAESGRWNAERQAVLAWPWTVMAEGRGRYLPSREAALREVRALQARGVRNIDVGCMQINLRYHPEAFDSLEQAFDPAYNVAYAARFLTDLYRELGDWPAALARYHSATPHHAERYRRRVVEIWRREQGGQAEQARVSADDPPTLHARWTPIVNAPGVLSAGAIGSPGEPDGESASKRGAIERDLSRRLAPPMRAGYRG